MQGQILPLQDVCCGSVFRDILTDGRLGKMTVVVVSLGHCLEEGKCRPREKEEHEEDHAAEAAGVDLPTSSVFLFSDYPFLLLSSLDLLFASLFSLLSKEDVKTMNGPKSLSLATSHTYWYVIFMITFQIFCNFDFVSTLTQGLNELKEEEVGFLGKKI